MSTTTSMGTIQHTELPLERLMLRATEVGQSLGYGRSKVYQLIASGELPSVRIGRSVRVPRSALLAWIARRTHTAPTQATNRPKHKRKSRDFRQHDGASTDRPRENVAGT